MGLINLCDINVGIVYSKKCGYNGILIYGTLIYVVINQFMLHTPPKKKRHYTTLNLGLGSGISLKHIKAVHDEKLEIRTGPGTIYRKCLALQNGKAFARNNKQHLYILHHIAHKKIKISSNIQQHCKLAKPFCRQAFSYWELLTSGFLCHFTLESTSPIL